MTTLQKFIISATVIILTGTGIYCARQGQNSIKSSSTSALLGTEAASPAKNPTRGIESARETMPEVQSLLAKLQSSNTETRLFAIKSIGNLGPKGHDAVPSLTQLLSNENQSIRVLTAQTLGKIGPNASAALPALRKCAETGSRAEQSMAKLAIKRIEN